MEMLDWLMVALYFGLLLGVAWWVIRKGRDTADDYFLAGRNLGWWVIGASIFASNIGSEHMVGLAGSGAKDGVAMAHYELHAWCLLVLAWVFVPFYARSLVFTMPEFLERRFSARLALCPLGGLADYLHGLQDRRGHFRRRRGVLHAVARDDNCTSAGVEIDSFWIGSVLVIVLTGLYTALGGMRAVAYNDAVQVVVLITGSGVLTVYGLYKLGGWHELRHICGSDMFNLWKPLMPAGVEGTWAPVLETRRRGQRRQAGLVFQRQFPLAGHADLRAGHRPVVLVHRPVHRAARPGRPNEQIARRGSIFAAFLKLLPRVPVHHPRHDLLRAGQERQGAGTGAMVSRRQVRCRRSARLPDDGQAPAAGGAARHRGGRTALGPDGLAGRRVQRLLHAVHRGPVREMEARRLAAPARAHRPHRHRPSWC